MASKFEVGDKVRLTSDGIRYFEGEWGFTPAIDESGIVLEASGRDDEWAVLVRFVGIPFPDEQPGSDEDYWFMKWSFIERVEENADDNASTEV